jgi:F-type H+-transporting ATPase subunit b
MKITRLSIYIAVLSLLSSLALAAEGAEAGIPAVVWYQVGNFALFVLILFFLLRKKVVLFFREREEAFRQAVLKAKATKEDADNRKRQIEERLSKLEASTSQSIEEARVEAENMHRQIVQEAKELSVRLQEDARRTADFEIQRAQVELRNELLTESLAAAKKVLGEKVVEADQKRLQTEFVDKIQVVRP